MNYKKIYDDLCDRGSLRGLEREKNYEIHHRVPRSLGGSDDRENLVKLTIEEHVIVHKCLERMYRGQLEHVSMLHALVRTTHVSNSHGVHKNKIRLTGKQVSMLRRGLSDAMKARQSKIIRDGLTQAQISALAAKERQIDRTLHEFYHDQHGKVVSSCYDLRVKYGIQTGNLQKVVDKCRFSEQGWYLYEHREAGIDIKFYNVIRHTLQALKLKQKSKSSFLAVININERSCKVISESEKERYFRLGYKELADLLVRKRRPVIQCKYCRARGVGTFITDYHQENCKKKPKPLPVCEYCGWSGDHGNFHKNHGKNCKRSPTHVPVKMKRITCPHCGKEGANNMLKRYHFNNCKLREFIRPQDE